VQQLEWLMELAEEVFVDIAADVVIDIAADVAMGLGYCLQI
jgi:hypothetical protein